MATGAFYDESIIKNHPGDSCVIFKDLWSHVITLWDRLTVFLCCSSQIKYGGCYKVSSQEEPMSFRIKCCWHVIFKVIWLSYCFFQRFRRDEYQWMWIITYRMPFRGLATYHQAILTTFMVILRWNVGACQPQFPLTFLLYGKNSQVVHKFSLCVTQISSGYLCFKFNCRYFSIAYEKEKLFRSRRSTVYFPKSSKFIRATKISHQKINK